MSWNDYSGPEKYSLIKDLVLFLGGLGILAYEVVTKFDSPILTPAALSMMGFSLYSRSTASVADKKNKSDDA